MLGYVTWTATDTKFSTDKNIDSVRLLASIYRIFFTDY